MADKTNPRAALDAALGEMRDANDGPGSHEQITSAATVACAEALSLLVDAHLSATAPEPDPRESLPDDTPVGHGWVMGWGGVRLFKPHDCGWFTWWLGHKWGVQGNWRKSGLPDLRPATVGDLRREGVPLTEWPDITAPEPEPEPEAEPVEPPAGAWVLVGGEEWLRLAGEWFRWSDVFAQGEPTVIHAPEEEPEPSHAEAKAIAERDNAIAALRAIRGQVVLGVCLADPNSDTRKTYRESLKIVEAEARRRGIDLSEEAP